MANIKKSLSAFVDSLALSNDIESEVQRLNHDLQTARQKSMAVQIRGSWIVYMNLWADYYEDIYISPQTGESYKSLDDMPPNTENEIVRTVKRWPRQEDFLRYLGDIGIPRSTFWARHTQIEKEIALYKMAYDVEMTQEIFATIAAETIAYGNQKAGEIVCEIFEFEREHNLEERKVVGYNPRLAKRLPNLEGETLQEVARAAYDYLQEIREAPPRERAGGARSQILRQYHVTPFQENGDLFLHLDPSDKNDDGRWVVEEPLRCKVKFQIGDEEYRLINLDPRLRSWIINKLNIN